MPVSFAGTDRADETPGHIGLEVPNIVRFVKGLPGKCCKLKVYLDVFQRSAGEIGRCTAYIKRVQAFLLYI